MKRILGCIALGLATMVASAQWSNPAEDIPAYNAAPPAKRLPPVLSGNQLTGVYFTHPYQVTAYKMAAAIPAVLHQEPCYCHCDKVLHHNSLHSMKEAIYAYQQTKKGEKPAQIRAGIERGDWQEVDLVNATM
jgi:hypothetical protein